MLLAVSAASLCACPRLAEGPKAEAAAPPRIKELVRTFAPDAHTLAADLKELTRAPHPFGSARQAEVTRWLEQRVQELGATSVREPFTATVPNPEALRAGAGPVSATLRRDGVNLYAKDVVPSAGSCAVVLASHFDTKVVAGTDYLGANDSGSSSAVLLQQIAFLKTNASKLKLTCDVLMVWFDGEEAVLAGWADGQTGHPARIQDNTYGSRHAAGRLTPCPYAGQAAQCLPAALGGQPLLALVLMDMIGSPDLALSREGESSAALLDLAEKAAQGLGYSD